MRKAQELYSLCDSLGKTLAVAESCTSGLLASKITEISGSSSYFKGGVIAYQNIIKTSVLGVAATLIEQHTEVSAIVAQEMVKGVQQLFDTDFAVSTTGYAGPSGGANNNPIGTVFIALATRESVVVNKFVFDGERQDIVSQAVDESLKSLISIIKKA